MDKVTSFLKDVKLEMSRVSWPTKEQTVKYTAVVTVISLIVAGFLGGLDVIFQYILNKII
ncbi:MAG: preprotein translocase subunit SecE [Candidatus Yanofskybacteria bacterium CG10_big_fil_rev_8_21_14_0_10_36_16]|uniref:Protein translocase subunit SecE n=1 Tax=Candidatus Yanofskybacteria bacterium CG10_big_fil_rev_8_21_14_0_10_36_16 TaxID=1975096 RepID=A0A2J0Q706_9BACT|nr:MAG: preprotein translocase subunit SecE [Candidatus Yanofskybacteria bacterium CG10_big_fil_rev_8_21_14_0_10_36_16]